MTDSKKISILVPGSAAGQRLDVFLATIDQIQTRNQALKYIEKRLVKVSGVLPLKVKASYRLLGNETIEVEIPEIQKSIYEPENIPVEILYQDNDVAVIEKPSGLVTHPATSHQTGTLVNALLFHIKDLSDIGGVERPGLVHRLDKDTSGVMVVAKNNKAHQGLSAQFKSHEIHRVYWALVAGVPKNLKGTITSNLGRHPVHRKAFCSLPEGKKAVTHYEVKATYRKQISLIAVTLETGRTHQIRVHMNELGCPVLGDQLYGIRKQKAWVTSGELKSITAKLKRQALHAAELGFEHPRTKENLKFIRSWPEDLKEILEHLEKFKNSP